MGFLAQLQEQHSVRAENALAQPSHKCLAKAKHDVGAVSRQQLHAAQLLPLQCRLLAIATFSAPRLGEGLAHGVEKTNPPNKVKKFWFN